jgi:hypothetical protein
VRASGPMVSAKADKRIKKLDRLKCKWLHKYEELMWCMVSLQILCIEYVVWRCLVADSCTACGCQEIQKRWGKEVGTAARTLR